MSLIMYICRIPAILRLPPKATPTMKDERLPMASGKRSTHRLVHVCTCTCIKIILYMCGGARALLTLIIAS